MKSDNMSTGRIERKRAHDREAQRASRAKTKAYIAHLEKTVADLSDSSGDNGAHYLAQHTSKQAQEIENLQGLVSKIRTLINDTTKIEQQQQQQSPIAIDSPLWKAESPHANPRRESRTEDITSPFEIEDSQSNTASNSDSPCSEDRFSTEIPRSTLQSTSTSSTTATSPGSTRNLVVLGESMHCEETDDCTFFTSLNRCIEKVESTPDHLSPLHIDEDILIRAILVHDWDAAERLHHFDIVWRFLRAFDEGLWQQHARSPIERLAHFWQMRSTLLHKICPKNQPRRATPAFMNPTLQQMVVQPHNLVADYYCWPRVRDRVIEQGIRGTTGRSSIAFTKAFRFDWPYEVRDAFRRNTHTGMYELSTDFVERFNNLASYRLVPPKNLAIGTTMAAETEPAAAPGAVHPALACAEPVANVQEVNLPSWNLSSSLSDEGASSCEESASSSSSSSDSIASFDVPPEALTPILTDMSDVVAADGKSAAEGWMPAFSMDISSEAAFMEYAMDQWPVL